MYMYIHVYIHTMYIHVHVHTCTCTYIGVQRIAKTFQRTSRDIKTIKARQQDWHSTLATKLK